MAVVGSVEHHADDQQLVLCPRLHVDPVNLSWVLRPSDLRAKNVKGTKKRRNADRAAPAAFKVEGLDGVEKRLGYWRREISIPLEWGADTAALSSETGGC